MGLFSRKDKSGRPTLVPDTASIASNNTGRSSTAPPSYRSRYSNETERPEPTSYRSYDYSTDPNTYDGNYAPRVPSYSAASRAQEPTTYGSSLYAEKGEPASYVYTPSYGASSSARNNEPTSYGVSIYGDNKQQNTTDSPNPYAASSSRSSPSPSAPSQRNVNPYSNPSTSSSSRTPQPTSNPYSAPTPRSRSPQNSNPYASNPYASNNYSSNYSTYGAGSNNYSQDDSQEPGTYQAAAIQAEMEEEDPEVLKASIRYTKQQSYDSTGRALHAASRAHMAGMNTLATLSQQEEQLLSAQKNLELAKSHGNIASYQAKDLKVANRALFMPHVNNPFSKGKQRAQEERERLLVQRNWSDRLQPERTQITQRQEQKAVRLGLTPLGVGNAASSAPVRGKKWGMYQFEADAEDDAIEQGIDDNLHQLASATSDLHMLAKTIGAKTEQSNQLLSQMNTDVNDVDDGLKRAEIKLRPYGF
ncbi:hypothetical protein H072_6256 [Dactylellina haptotyla CBS 200.50]|uniref:t-SNARE coiled-coil homology domain-containing protein n=1 Tax=Dactylellina haptotyla (strain CBS 200.50) TaxID=1284197 RepID=S8AAN0_DACHA|nr:hypothetical protein H072_6256 [Dactylellina haptotyla CBS 200.50]